MQFFPESPTREWMGIGQSEVRRLMFRSDGQARAFNPRLAFSRRANNANEREQTATSPLCETVSRQFSPWLPAAYGRFLFSTGETNVRDSIPAKNWLWLSAGLASATIWQFPKKTITIPTVERLAFYVLFKLRLTKPSSKNVWVSSSPQTTRFTIHYTFIIVKSKIVAILFKFYIHACTFKYAGWFARLAHLK